ncbi:helix-turn-helix domain-containing protein [Chryseobacterium mulctrae]|uniref:helix-turn-helix domain-containing protein n=1 Tax=Chryseobacterium mulctrae TaxID=2576777 RepID=UPI0011172A61|nr:helix-turn-helix domain-containing protein [Chryseobacterium mulctrae]
MTPDYKRIYTDLLEKKLPSRYHEFKDKLERKDLNTLDIIRINQSIFGSSNSESEAFNQKHRSYNKATILQILDYQKAHKLSNIQLALHFKLSRNTVSKWKKLFP